MKLNRRAALAGLAALCSLAPRPAPAQDASAPALTLYNQDFAVVRQTVPLTLRAGLNHVTVNDITVHVEPDSVILRDPTGQRSLSIREQNYRADPLTQPLLLSLYEGQTIPFVTTRNNQTVTVMGRIIRSGYVPPDSSGFADGQYYPGRYQPNNDSPNAVVEVDGKIQFGLPGQPQFPALPNDTILKPTLDWTLDADKGGPLTAELAYVTGGMTWSAAYNIVAPETDTGTMDLVGWVTMENQSGKTFPNARIKLMAGDVSKLQPGTVRERARQVFSFGGTFGGNPFPPVTEKTFDEYHLYTLQHPTTLRDQETKQVEFVRAGGISYKQIYVYDGSVIDPQRYNGYNYDSIRNDQSYGAQSNPKVAVMREFVNSLSNHLGMPLPAGRVRFYKQDSDRQLEFTGENQINHTPKDETLRIYTGNAFDLTGERTQTDFKIMNSATSTLDESFSITVRNHKTMPVEVRVVEHLYRGATWTIPAHSRPFTKTDAHTIEFRVPIAPDAAQTLTYTAHYTW